MAVPVSQVATVAKYALSNTIKGRKRYPLVMMLEPLFQCNLACSGCGKIQYGKEILDIRMPKEKAWAALEECGAPVVSIAGGEPAPPRNARNGRRFRTAQKVRVYVHERADSPA